MSVLREINTDVLAEGESLVPENACHNYERCGNVVPANGATCADCLDNAAENDG